MTLSQQLDRTLALKDLEVFQSLLEHHFAYLDTNEFGHELPALLTNIAEKLPEQQALSEWAETLYKVLCRSVDGHARIRQFVPVAGALPALLYVSDNHVVAVQPDHSAFLLADFPYLTAIDGRNVEEWLSAVGTLVSGVGPTWRRQRAVSGLNLLQQWRHVLQLPERHQAILTLSNGTETRELTVELVAERPQYGVWPASESGWLGEIGYLRLSTMTLTSTKEITRWLPEFQTAEGLIIDVRGNSGGARETFMPLVRALLARTGKPKIVNVAVSRQSDTENAARMEGRFLYPASSPRWTAEEQVLIQSNQTAFQPSWMPPDGQFSEWHYMVVQPPEPDDIQITCPVVVLMDGLCFSATDIFLCGVQGLPNVTLLGEASGGGSGSPRVHTLPSGIQFRAASMASFKPSGELLEGNGVSVDTKLQPDPTFFLQGGEDNLLQAALEILTSATP